MSRRTSSQLLSSQATVIVTGLQEMRAESVACLHPQLDKLHGGHWVDLVVPGPWRMLSARMTSTNLGNYNKKKLPPRPRTKSLISMVT